MVALRFVVVTVYWVRQQTFFDGGGNNPLLLEPTKLSLKRMPVTRRLSGNEGSPSKRSISLSRAHASGAWWIATTSIMQARCFFSGSNVSSEKVPPCFCFPFATLLLLPVFSLRWLWHRTLGSLVWNSANIPARLSISVFDLSLLSFFLFFPNLTLWICLFSFHIYLSRVYNIHKLFRFQVTCSACNTLD